MYYAAWPKEGHTTLILRWTAFSVDYRSVCCGIVSLSFWNVTRFISGQYLIHFFFLPRSCIHENGTPAQSLREEKRFLGLRCGLCGGQSRCKKDA